MKIEKYVDTVSGQELEKHILYYDNGNIKYEYYYLNNEWHREDGPAKMWYNESGQIGAKEYWINNQLHKEDGPAMIDYYEDSKVYISCYYLNYKLHRIDGPAKVCYNKDSSIEKEEYWEYGKEMDILKEMVIRGLEKEKNI